MGTALAFVGRILVWVVIFSAVAIIAVAVVVPRIAGATPYTILTGSMSPAYPPGTLVVVSPVDVADLTVGDVVTVQIESGEPTVVTHRIASIAYQLDGEIQIETRGDANASPDLELRLPAQIRGKLWYALPYLGFVSTALTGGDRQLIVTIIAVALLGYAVWMFAGGWRDRRRRTVDTSQIQIT